VTETTVQCNTVRKMKSAFVNLYHASVENQGSAIVGGEMGNGSFLWMHQFTLSFLEGFRLECITEWETKWFKILVCHEELCRSFKR
jgi:hypothetical protein